MWAHLYCFWKVPTCICAQPALLPVLPILDRVSSAPRTSTLFLEQLPPDPWHPLWCSLYLSVISYNSRLLCVTGSCEPLERVYEALCWSRHGREEISWGKEHSFSPWDSGIFSHFFIYNIPLKRVPFFSPINQNFSKHATFLWRFFFKLETTVFA